MKRIFFLIPAVFTLILLVNCPTPSDPATMTAADPAAEEDAGFVTASDPGDTGVLTLTESADTITMIYANNQSSITFPTETWDTGQATLTRKFFLSETETANAVMAAVLQWAVENNRFSSTVTDHNGLDINTVKHGGQQLLDLDDPDCRVDYDGSGTFSAESGYEDHPVSNVTWYGAVMFCNWMTEMRDGNTDNVVYTGLDTTWDDDETTENDDRNGYRLPYSYEWEYAARYRGSDPTNTVGAFTDPYYTIGNAASGATTFYQDNANGSGEPGKTANDTVAVYGSYWDAGSWVSTGASDEAAVKSRGANALGLYDMSGNLWEWCFDKPGSSWRNSQGGSWYNSAADLRVGAGGAGSNPETESGIKGFRIYRTQ